MQREDWDARYAGAENLWSAKPHRVLVAEASDLAPGRALDLACGEGQNAIWLASRGWEVAGVDFSAVAIEKGRSRAAAAGVDVTFICDDLLAYTPASGRYDLVLLFYLHIPASERPRVLEGAASALAAGGALLLLGHHLANLTEGVGGPKDPGLLFTPEDVVRELPGLDIERAEAWLRDVDGEDRPAVDVLVRARRPARDP